MTEKHYVRQWKSAEKEVEKVVEKDRAYVKEDVIEDRSRAYKQAASNYIRYIMCVNKLGKCLDQMVHVQKRQSIRDLLEATMARLLQVKQELVNMDLSDFNYLDDVMIEMKLTPYDVEIQVPQYYRRDREDKLKNIKENINQILEELANPPLSEQDLTLEEAISVKEDPSNKSKTDLKEKLPDTATTETKRLSPQRPPAFVKVELTEAQKLFKSMVHVIQNHERARTARLKVQQLKEKKRIQHDIAWQIHKPIPADTLDRSVRLIQRWWRGYRTRRHVKHHRTEARLLMGEVTPSWRPVGLEARAREVAEACRRRQREVDEAYAEARRRLEAAVRHRDADIMDDMADHLRWWVEDWFRKVGELPAFPDKSRVELLQLLGLPPDISDDWVKKMLPAVPPAHVTYPGLPEQTLGGSALIVAGYWVDPELYDLAHTAVQIAKGKKEGKVDKKEKLTKQQLKELKEQEKEKKRLEEEVKQKELEEKQLRGVVPAPTTLLDPINRELDKSKMIWSTHEDLHWNAGQKYRSDIPVQEFVLDQHGELREVVDDLMRLELERLQAALDRDRGKKRKQEKKKKKKEKGKKGKKDLTADRTQESLFRELVENGIIKKPEDVRIDSIFCQPSWNNWDLRRDPWWEDPLPNLWDVKQVVKEYCILPLGSSSVHRAAPLVRSVLLAGGGPELGQDTLAAAVAYEAGAVLFDLSPSNTAGKYPGKKGLNMLVHLVSKMSRLLQPSVVLIRGGEKPFYKKIPNTEKEDNPKLLNKQLPKMVKAVTPDDQVLFLATSDNPFAGKSSSMEKTYDKILPVAVPDQSSSAAYWHHQLMQYHGVDRDFLYSPVAWCAQGYPLPVIDHVIRTVLTPERVVALKYKPLHPQELLDVLLDEQVSAVSEAQRQKLQDWYHTTYPLARKRAEKLKTEGELREKLAALDTKNDQKQKAG